MLIRREDYRREEYIWIDGSKPTAKIRSKTRVGMRVEQPGLWGFDGSSTNQAVGSNSDCVIRPVLSIKDPVRKKLDTLLGEGPWRHPGYDRGTEHGFDSPREQHPRSLRSCCRND